MRNRMFVVKAAFLPVLFALSGYGQGLSPELKAKVDLKVKQLQAWSTDAAIVAAVKAGNTTPAPEAAGMTNEKWKALTILDPAVRSFTRNALAMNLKTKKDAQINECFVSAANGTKVAFLAKPTSWSHADKEKHRVPMTGKTWIGPVEMDESTGDKEVQVAIPVLDGGKAIGSIVIGLAVAKL